MLRIEGTLVPINYTTLYIEKRFKPVLLAISVYMVSAPNELCELLIRPGRTLDSRYSRSDSGTNNTVVADACVRKLLCDLDHQLVDPEYLRNLSQAYHDRDRDAFMTVTFDPVAMDELDLILKHFDRLKVLVKPISKKGTPNRKSPLNIAIEYCHQYVLKKQSN